MSHRHRRQNLCNQWGFDPRSIPEVAAGYWWHPDLDTGFGTTDFRCPEGNGHTTFDLVQPTVASQPTLLTENGGKQYRMRNAADGNPSLLGTAAAVAAGWTGPTYIGGWFRLPAGGTGAGVFFQHNTAGTQARINFNLSTLGLITAVSTNGSASVNNQYLAAPVLTSLNWAWCEMAFLGVGATDADRAKAFVDFVEQTRNSGSGTIPATIFDATAKIGIGCRFQNALANVDTTDRSGVFYCNGIPSTANRHLLANASRPIAALL